MNKSLLIALVLACVVAITFAASQKKIKSARPTSLSAKVTNKQLTENLKQRLMELLGRPARTQKPKSRKPTVSTSPKNTTMLNKIREIIKKYRASKKTTKPMADLAQTAKPRRQCCAPPKSRKPVSKTMRPKSQKPRVPAIGRFLADDVFGALAKTHTPIATGAPLPTRKVTTQKPKKIARILSDIIAALATSKPKSKKVTTTRKPKSTKPRGDLTRRPKIGPKKKLLTRTLADEMKVNKTEVINKIKTMIEKLRESTMPAVTAAPKPKPAVQMVMSENIANDIVNKFKEFVNLFRARL